MTRTPPVWTTEARTACATRAGTGTAPCYPTHPPCEACREEAVATAIEQVAHAIQQVKEARACVVDVPDMELGEVVL